MLEDYDYGDDHQCDYCYETDGDCLCDEALSCTCGAYGFSEKNGVAMQVSDCVCGRT